MTLRQINWMEHVGNSGRHQGDLGFIQNLSGKPEENSLGKCKCTWDDDIKLKHRKIVCEL